MSSRILRQDRGGLCTITLNRPEKLNALDGVFFDELDALVSDLEQKTESIGCVLLRGNGRSFCAGADLSGVGSEQRDPRRNTNILTRFANLPQPIVAAVHGVCYTGGLELALACDFIIAEESARFADTHGKWGFVAMWGMTQRLPRRIGFPATKRMMMTSSPIGAIDACEMGLVDEVAPEGGLKDAVGFFTSSLLNNSWFTNFAVKRMMAETAGMPLAQGLAYETMHWPGSSADSSERISKFIQK